MKSGVKNIYIVVKFEAQTVPISQYQKKNVIKKLIKYYKGLRTETCMYGSYYCTLNC